MSTQLLGIIGLVAGLYALVWWLIHRSEKKAVEANTLKMHNEINQDASEKNKNAAEIYSKPDISDPIKLADKFSSLPD